GTGLTATLKLTGWDMAQKSAEYTISAAAPVQANSSIQTNLAAYTAGDEMLVTVTLKDAYQNGVASQKSDLTDTTVTVE
ncbi:hypothetical protein, partial [Providencia rettgeri]|uniref:hypothetical protein n=1 Tax=Providencia rettgeri TaxID=587 RepID=UPI00301A2CCF